MSVKEGKRLEIIHQQRLSRGAFTAFRQRRLGQVEGRGLAKSHNQTEQTGTWSTVCTAEGQSYKQETPSKQSCLGRVSATDPQPYPARTESQVTKTKG